MTKGRMLAVTRSALVVALLLNAGCASKRYTPLMSAAAVGDVPTVERILQESKDVDEQAFDGSTALMRAAVGGHWQIVDMLIAAGAELTREARNGWTALRYAVAAKHEKIVERLRSPSRDRPAEVPPEEKETRRLTESREISVPVALHQVTPRFTNEALAEKLTGKVVVECIIKKDGTTDPVRIVESLSSDLDLRAIEAARQWRFEPARLDGEPVDVLVDIVINFNIL